VIRFAFILFLQGITKGITGLLATMVLGQSEMRVCATFGSHS
jgi:hypothetical protein